MCSFFRIKDEHGHYPKDYEYTEGRLVNKPDASYNLDGTRRVSNKRSCRSCINYRGNLRCTRFPNKPRDESWGVCSDAFYPILEYQLSHFWNYEKHLSKELLEIGKQKYMHRYLEKLEYYSPGIIKVFEAKSKSTGSPIKKLLAEYYEKQKELLEKPSERYGPGF